MNIHDQQSRFSNNVTKSKLGMPLVLAAGVGALALMPSIAMAAPWDAAIGAIAGTLQGTLGKGIAIVAVIALGLMAMAGKLEWMTAIKVVVGIVIMFSAAQIINWIAPNAGVSEKMSGNVIAASGSVDCNAKGGIWVPQSKEVQYSDGSVASPAKPATCIDTTTASGIASATMACKATINTSAAGVATDPSALAGMYYKQAGAITLGSTTCAD